MSAERPTPEPPKARSGKRRPWTVVRIVVSAGALAYLVHKAGIAAIGHRLGHVAPAWLIAGFVLGGLSALWTVMQWHRLLRVNGIRITYLRALRLELAGDVFDAALPSAIGGDVVRATLVPRTPDERSPGAASVLLRRVCNFPGLLILLAVSLAVTSRLAYPARIRPYAGIAVALGVVAVIVAFGPGIGWLADSRLGQWRFGRPVAKVLHSMAGIRDQRTRVMWAGLRGLGFWCLVVASQWSFMHAVGIHVGIAYATLVVATTNTITMLPISLGGYGLREGAFSYFLAVGGLATTSQGIAVGVCLTLQTMILGLIGIPFYLGVRRREKPADTPAAPPMAVAA